MLIDWFTVICQIINFLVLVWLLKRFLYRPILNAIDARQERVNEQLAEAEKRTLAADEEKALFQKKNEDFERERQRKLKALNDEVELLRAQLLADVRAEVAALRAEWSSSLQRERDSICRELKDRVQEEVLSIARRVVEDFAGVKLEEYTIEVFLQRLSRMLKEKDPTLSRFRQPTESLQVTTTFPLSTESHAAVMSALGQEFGKEVNVAFAVSPKVVTGIELMASGQKVSWSMGEYLTTFEHHLNDILVNKARKIHA